MPRYWVVPAACLFCLLFFDVTLQAYLDPGSGSMLLQILLGGFAAVGVIAKLYWNRVSEWFGRKDGRHGSNGSAPP